MDIKSLIRTIPDFPKKGILFRDSTTLMKDGPGFHYLIETFKNRYQDQDFDVIAGIEARGFTIGAALAYALKKGFVPIRKKGKLPAATISQSYQLEYGTDTMEIHTDAIVPGMKVLLIDDLMATGGTMLGAISLIEKLQGKVFETAVIIDLPDLQGSEKIRQAGHKFYTVCEYSGH